VLKHFHAAFTVEQMPTLEKQLNAALQDQIPCRVWRKPQDIAIDMHDRPYYGKLSQEEGLWCYGRPKASTKRFYRIGTAYVMHKQVRTTLAVIFMPPAVSPLDCLKRLLAHIARLDIPVKCLWMDRGYGNVATVRFLTEQGWPAVVGCPIRGTPEGKGTRALCHGRKSYQTDHEFTSRDHQKFTAQLVVCRVFEKVWRQGVKCKKAAWQIFAVINIDLTPRQIRRHYRRRFGIETSYRCSNQVRGWTTSPNPVYRFVLMTLAFYITNVWTRLQWLYTQVPRKGGRYLDTKAFRLSRLTSFVCHALESVYGYLNVVHARAAPLL
jgi:putative transposase